jgi:Fe-S-cluster containining protein
VFDCQTCGACCSYSADWPRLTTDGDRGPGGPPAELRTDDGYVRCTGDRCDALEGVVGRTVRCTIYERRPAPCRACTPGDRSCLAARTAFGLEVPDEPSTMEF